MMVNELRNQSHQVPWQSTVPQQMPWMTPYICPASSSIIPSMQFGQQQQQPQSANVQPPSQQQPIPANTNDNNNLFGFQPTSINASFNSNVTPLPSVPGALTSNLTSQPQSVFSTPIPNQPMPVILPTQTNFPCSLTHMPNSNYELSQPSAAILPHKRTSIEMDEDFVGEVNEPPAKQLLSEKKLLKKFGTLKLNGLNTNDRGSSDDSDDSIDENPIVSSSLPGDADKDDINKYVYILFKDRQTNESYQNLSSNTTLDRLAREERDKLSKAVMLWNPPMRNHYTVTSEDSDDEDFTYKDHLDFLKERPIIYKDSMNQDDCSITITDVTLDNDKNQPDDLMFD